ncbi:MAG: uracil phosphoribosyltransferase [Candidatus Melainabacteria bacterium]|nr:uracil phosphoribosyltransferase [Candidatus Melainabacteria bacterium]
MPVIKSSNSLTTHWLNIARDKKTLSEQFRTALENIGLLLFSEAISSLDGITLKKDIKTPLKRTQAKFINQKNIYIVPVLRAALGMLTGIKSLIPEAKVAHVGLYRSIVTLKPNWYLDKLPKKTSKKSIFFVLEPMLATGGTISSVLERIKALGVSKIYVISVIVSEGAKKKLEEKFPDVRFYVAGIDPYLNSKGFIIPGLGDAGDRVFNM